MEKCGADIINAGVHTNCPRSAIAGTKRCILHTQIPKDATLFWQAIAQELASQPADKPVDLRAAVFPPHSWASAIPIVERDLLLDDCEFGQGFSLSGSQFRGSVSFRRAVFKGNLGLSHANFGMHHIKDTLTNFDDARFEGDLYGGALFNTLVTMRMATFCGRVTLDGGFNRAVDISGASFAKDFHCISGRFFGSISFQGCTFSGGCDIQGFMAMHPMAVGEPRQVFDFRDATFMGDINLRPMMGSASVAGSTFHQRFRKDRLKSDDSDYSRVIFKAGADFAEVRFPGSTSFARAVFGDNATFAEAKFQSGVSFKGAVFSAAADFAYSSFASGGDAEANVADFSDVRFERPERVSFLRANGRDCPPLRARFLNTDIRRVSFEDVNWLEHRGRLLLQDELDITQTVAAPEHTRTHELVATAYHRLVISFDAVRNFDRSEEAFEGAMEMKRRDPRGGWLNRTVVEGYRVFSRYGSSYERAALWLCTWLAVFAVLWSLPFVGLVSVDSKKAASPAMAIPAPTPPGWYQHLKNRVVPPVIQSIQVAAFQRERMYDAPRGRGVVLMVVEQVVIGGQLALLLLGLQRRFKR